MRLTAKTFFYIMISATIASFFGIIGAFYWGNQQLQSKADVIANLQADTDISEAKIIALSRAKEGNELVSDATKLLDKLLPKQKEQERLIADLIYTATVEADIEASKIGALTFSSESAPSDLSGTEQSKDVPGVLTYPFSMSVQNISYETLLKLLSEIENNNRLVQIEDLQISPDKQSPGQISSVSLSLKAFLKP